MTERGGGTARHRRRVRSVIAAGSVAVALGVATAGTASAEGADPNGPYDWDCGTSRSGGLHVEAFGRTIRVLLTNTVSGDRTVLLSGNVAVDVDGGPYGTAYVFASNDGAFSPDTHPFCGTQP